MFKWVCLLVAVVALTAFGWMLNDIRLEVKGLAHKADKLVDKSDDLVAKTDKSLPSILKQTEQATRTIDTQLPSLLARVDTAADDLTDVSENLKQCKGLLGLVHRASQNKDLFDYGASILDLIGKQNATVGVKQTTPVPMSDPSAYTSAPHPLPVVRLARAMPAKTWANHARKDAQFLSLIAKNKGEVLHGLARTASAAPWLIQLGEQAAPRLLADWIKETHPESKDVIP